MKQRVWLQLPQEQATFSIPKEAGTFPLALSLQKLEGLSLHACCCCLSHLAVVSSPPGRSRCSRRVSSTFGEEVLVELLCGLQDTRMVNSGSHHSSSSHLPCPQPLYLPGHRVADWNDGPVCQLKDTQDFTSHDIQGQLGHQGDPAGFALHQALADWGGRERGGYGKRECGYGRRGQASRGQEAANEGFPQPLEQLPRVSYRSQGKRCSSGVQFTGLNP